MSFQAPASVIQVERQCILLQAAHAEVAKRASGHAGLSTAGLEGEGAASPQLGRAPKRVRRAKAAAGADAGAPGSNATGNAQKLQPRQRKWQGAQDRGLRAGKEERGVNGMTVSDSQNRQRRGRVSDAAGSEVRQAAPAKGKPPKRRKTESERGDKLDGLVALYKQQLFGDAKGKREAAKSSMQRWFD